MPDFKIVAAAWILAGGAHHTGYSQAVTTAFMEDFADMMDMEIVVIDENTRIRESKNEIRWNDLYYHLKKEY